MDLNKHGEMRNILLNILKIKNVFISFLNEVFYPSSKIRFLKRINAFRF